MSTRRFLLPALALLLALGSTAALATEASDGTQNEHDHVHGEAPSRGLVHAGLEERSSGPCAGSWEVDDGDRDTVICSHGPDASPPWVGDVRSAQAAPVTAEEAAVGPGAVCDGDGVQGNRVQALYVLPSDQPDRFGQYVDSIRTWAATVQQHYRNSAAKTGGDLAMRFVHSPVATDGTCVIDVQKVVVAPTADDSFGATIAAVEAAGWDSPTRNYAMWVEASLLCGIGTLYNNDSPNPAYNPNNADIASYSRVDRGCWDWAAAMTHELTHNVGGVQNSAPNSSGGYHCNDGRDIMCYADGGSSSNYTTSACPAYSADDLLDCGDNDYFHTNPPAGSYLADHWNVANSKWLFTPPPPPLAPAHHDVDGDGLTDFGLYRPSSGDWLVDGVPLPASAGLTPVAGDYDADGMTELALWDPTTGTVTVDGLWFGEGGHPGDIARSGDLDGDGADEVVFFDPTKGRWRFADGSASLIWGKPGDVPLLGDFDGDDVDELTVWRPSKGRWFPRGLNAVLWGRDGDTPIAHDVDRDGTDEMVVWRPSNATWWQAGVGKIGQWGGPNDVPALGDYDGDGSADLAVWRPHRATLWIDGIGPVPTGQSADLPTT